MFVPSSEVAALALSSCTSMTMWKELLDAARTWIILDPLNLRMAWQAALTALHLPCRFLVVTDHVHSGCAGDIW